MQRSLIFENQAHSKSVRRLTPNSSSATAQTPNRAPSNRTPSQRNLPVSSPVKSQQLLSRVLDADLSPRSPSRKKLLCTLNASKQPFSSKLSNGTIDTSLAQRFSNYYSECQSFEDTTVLAKGSQVGQYINCLEDSSTEVRIAGLEALHSLLATTQIPAFNTEQILECVLSHLQNWDELPEEYVTRSLELLALVGPHRITSQYSKLLAAIVVHDQTVPNTSVHLAALKCLVAVNGLHEAVALSLSHDTYFQHWLLGNLLKTSVVQRAVLVPALAKDSLSADSKTRSAAVAALSRLYGLVHEGGALPTLLVVLEDGTTDQQLVASAIRASGQKGELVLARLLREHPDVHVRKAAAGSLCWNVPERPKQLQFNLVKDAVTERLKPGSMCQYIGPVCPVMYEPANEEAVLEVSARELLSQLLTFVRTAKTFCEVRPEEPSGLTSVSVKALKSALKDPAQEVRERAAFSLGFIGLPQASAALEDLVKVLKDFSSQVRATACWALSRLAPESAWAAPAVLGLLKDEYWKVRTAACIALASYGSAIRREALPVLLKALKEGTIARETIAETVVHLGAGQALLGPLADPCCNLTLRLSLIKAFSFTQLEDPSFDMIIETLFKLTADSMAKVRKQSLQTLKYLSLHTTASVTYLTPRSLLPVCFDLLKDPEAQVRHAALQCIKATGPQGQLMLVEALTKSENATVRVQAAKGLAKFGPANFRTLLLGMHDSIPEVRKAAASGIAQLCANTDPLSLFGLSQLRSIQCSVKEILGLPYPVPLQCRSILTSILGTSS